MEFRREAVKLMLSSGRARREIVEDLGTDLSTLTLWASRDCGVGERLEAQADLHDERLWLRRESALLRQECDVLKKAVVLFVGEVRL